MSGPNSKPQKGNQNFRTPKPFLDAVLRRLGWACFDFDLACTLEDSVGVQGGWTHPRVNALTADWQQLTEANCWLNPPFAKAGAFAAKCASSGARIAALVPVALGTRWWREHVHEKAVVLGVGRLTFNLPDGTPMLNPKTGKPQGINRDCALLVYGGVVPSSMYRSWYPCEDWKKW